MTPQRPIQTVEELARTQIIIWAALTLSQVLLLATLVFRRFETPLATGAGRVDTGLYVAAAVLALAGSGYRRFAYSDPQLQKLGERVQTDPTEARLPHLLALIQTPLIVSLALNEAVALCGFVIAFLHQDATRFLPFLTAGVLLNVLAFPRPARVIARVKELVPQLATLSLVVALLTGCSFVGGDFTPMAKEPETPCLLEARDICKDKLGSADIGNCVAREKYRCELLEEEKKKAESPTE